MEHFDHWSIQLTFSVLTIIGMCFGGYKALTTFQTKKKEEGLDSLRKAAERYKDETELAEFLNDLEKETILHGILKIQIRPNEIQPLAEFRKRGFATMNEIKQAWPHRDIESEVFFSLSWRLKAILHLGNLYMILCLIFSAAAYSFYSSFPNADNEFLFYAISFFFYSAIPILTNRSTQTAYNIIRRVEDSTKSD